MEIAFVINPMFSPTTHTSLPGQQHTLNDATDQQSHDNFTPPPAQVDHKLNDQQWQQQDQLLPLSIWSQTMTLSCAPHTLSYLSILISTGTAVDSGHHYIRSAPFIDTIKLIYFLCLFS